MCKCIWLLQLTSPLSPKHSLFFFLLQDLPPHRPRHARPLQWKLRLVSLEYVYLSVYMYIISLVYPPTRIPLSLKYSLFSALFSPPRPRHARPLQRKLRFVSLEYICICAGVYVYICVYMIFVLPNSHPSFTQTFFLFCFFLPPRPRHARPLQRKLRFVSLEYMCICAGVYIYIYMYI